MQLKMRFKRYVTTIVKDVIDGIIYAKTQEIIATAFQNAFSESDVLLEAPWFSNETARIIGHTLRRKVSLTTDQELGDTLEAHVEKALKFIESEEFIDNVIDRINRKQLSS